MTHKHLPPTYALPRVPRTRPEPSADPVPPPLQVSVEHVGPLFAGAGAVWFAAVVSA